MVTGFRHELPWLRSGPILRVHGSATGELDALLARDGWHRIELDGARMTDRAAAHREIGRAFGFPEWYGNSWDAYHDCCFGFVEAHEGHPVMRVIAVGDGDDFDRP